MRLLFCVNRDIYTNLVLNHILAKLQGVEAMVLFSERLGPRQLPAPTLEFMRFFEQDLINQYLFPLYEALPDRENRLLTFNELSSAYQVPMRVIRNINSPETVENIQTFDPDLVISVRFGQIFRESVIQIPRHGVINLHSGLLPAYRGVLATFWSMLNADEEHGYTLHYIADSSIDTGAMIERKSLPIDPAQSLFWHIASLYPPAADSIVKAVEGIRNGVPLQVVPQMEAGSCYYGLPKAEDFARFQQKGLKLFDEAFYYEMLGRYCDMSLPPMTLSAFNSTAYTTV